MGLPKYEAILTVPLDTYNGKFSFRLEHPLLVEGRDKCEWVLPITVHAPPQTTSAAHIQNDKSFSLEPLWIRT